MQNPLANFIGVFSLVRDDRGFQVNPLCRHDITSPFPPSGNVSGYIYNHGSLNRERDTASPSGRYGERLQLDSCLKHTI